MRTHSIDNASSQFMTPQPPARKSMMPGNSPHERKTDPFHVVHKVPSGDSPYVKAKHVQLIDKEPSKAIALFWAAINAGDRVDSALKDMAIVMKQLDRSDEAIEAIKSFRHLCPYDSQESIDNVLIELYKRAGRIEEEIEMLQCKLQRIEEGAVFNGRRTKTARSQGKKVQVTIHQERSRVLGNMGWAYMQLKDYETAHELYRKALILEPDNNKQCNLALCLMHMNRIAEAEAHLLPVVAYAKTHHLDESCAKSFDRALQLFSELKPKSVQDLVDGRSLLLDSAECRASKAAGQGYVPAVEPYRKLKNSRDAEVKLLKRGSACLDYQHIDDSAICQNEANSKYVSCRPETPRSSPPNNSWEKRNVLGQMQESPFSNAPAEVTSGSTRIHAPKRRLFNTPSTQQRKCSWDPKFGHEKRNRWTPNVGRNSSRKLCFEKTFPSGSFQLPTKLAYKEDPKAIDDDWSAKKSVTSLLSPQNMSREKPREEGPGRMQHAFGKPYFRVLANENLGQTSWGDNRYAQEHNEAENHSQEKEGLQQMLNVALPVDKTGVMETPPERVRYHCSNKTAPHSMVLKDIAEEIWPDHDGQSDCSWNPQRTMHMESSKNSKSWADLVEEEEQELSTQDIYRESIDFVEEFKDENLDSNISESDLLVDQEQYMRQRLQLLDLVDGQCAPPTVVSFRQSTVKRFINFGQQQKCESATGSPCISRCPESFLNSEKPTSIPDSKTNFTSVNCAQPKRKHRLQVFCDITPQLESPGA